MDTPLTLVIVDRSELFRKGLTKVLEGEANMRVLRTFPSGPESLEPIIELKPDVILVGTNIQDYSRQDFNAPSVSKRVREKLPNTQAIVLGEVENAEDFFYALRLGARAYLSKYVSSDYLIDTIKRVHSGEVIIPPTMARLLIKEIGQIAPDQRSPEATEPDYRLTGREKEVLDLVAKCKSNKEIADLLCISENTAKRHLSSILEKLHVRKRQEAANLAVEKRIVSK